LPTEGKGRKSDRRKRHAERAGIILEERGPFHPIEKDRNGKKKKELTR